MVRVSKYLVERLRPMGFTEKEIVEIELVLSASKAGKKIVVVNGNEETTRDALNMVLTGAVQEIAVPAKKRVLSQETLNKRYQQKLKELKEKYNQGDCSNDR